MNVIHLIAVLAVALGDTACGKVHYPQDAQEQKTPRTWPIPDYEEHQFKKAVEVLDWLRAWDYYKLHDKDNYDNRKAIEEHEKMSIHTSFIFASPVHVRSKYKKEIASLYSVLKKGSFDNEAAREKAMQDFAKALSLVLVGLEDNSKEWQDDIKECKKKMRRKKGTVEYIELKWQVEDAQSKVKENKDTVKYIKKLQAELGYEEKSNK